MSFNENVWKLCSKVPKGKVTTYKEIAKALNTKAYRAVGNALNKNPDSSIIPCHRVVGSDGSLVGFAKGLRKKAEMLRKEGIKVKDKRILDFEKALYRF